MSSERFLELLKSILNTHAGLKWEETGSEDTFRLQLGDGVVAISKYEAFDEYAEEPYTEYKAELFNKTGTKIEDIQPGDAEKFQLLKSIFEKARSTALKVDVVLDSMFKDLNNYR